jgi:hypothetical protein
MRGPLLSSSQKRAALVTGAMASQAELTSIASSGTKTEEPTCYGSATSLTAPGIPTAAVDLTLVDRTSGREVDMGTAFDHFGPKSAYAHPSIAAVQWANRAQLRSVMQQHGFAPIPQEWWHFSLRREPFPNPYFSFLVR